MYYTYNIFIIYHIYDWNKGAPSAALVDHPRCPLHRRLHLSLRQRLTALQLLRSYKEIALFGNCLTFLFTFLHLYRKELILNYPLNCIRLLTSLTRSRPLSDVNDCRTLSFWQGQQTAGWVEYREGLEWIVNYSGFESLAISVTGALINLIMILILSFFYNRIAVWLTDKELHR